MSGIARREVAARLDLARALAAEGPALAVVVLGTLTSLDLPAELGWQALRGLGQGSAARLSVVLRAAQLGALTRAGLLLAIEDPDLVVVEELERFVRRWDAERRRMADVPTSLVPASAGEVRDLIGRLFGGMEGGAR